MQADHTWWTHHRTQVDLGNQTCLQPVRPEAFVLVQEYGQVDLPKLYLSNSYMLYSGLHDNIHPLWRLGPSLASELVGLITRKNSAISKCTSQTIRNSFSQMLPPHIITVLQKWALISKEKWHPLLTMTPLPRYWSEHPRGKVCMANRNAFSSKFSFSICYPIYHENTMHLATRHVIYSAALSTKATTTYMFFPS